MSRWDLTPSTPISFDDLDDLTPRLDLRDQRADAAGGATTDRAAAYGIDTRPDDPPEGERWSTWEDATHGPHPLPDWVITAHGAVEQDLGILKSGKEADVHVIRRWLPDGSDTPAHDSYLNIHQIVAAVPLGRAPTLPSGRGLPRRAPGPAQPRDAGDGETDHLRP